VAWMSGMATQVSLAETVLRRRRCNTATATQV
jgi:hypothetical protein